MSADTEQERGPQAEAVLDQFQRWYHIPALVLVLGYMLWVRLLPYDRLVTDDGVHFVGNDAYYHYRATMYSVENWPFTLFEDPWTYFPYGSTSGQFGTLFDQVFATVALIVGLGDPSARQVAIIAVIAPAVLGALVAIPTYFLATHLTRSRLAGIIAAGVLALLPQGVWVTRSTAGFYDHHVAETLLMATAIFATMVALATVQRERPVYEQVQDRDWEGLRTPTKYSALAGVAVAAYLLTWPSGIVLVGILGIYFVIALSLEVVRGDSPEHLAFAGAVSMGVAGLLVLPFIEAIGFETTTLSLLQVFGALGVAAACVAIAGLARYWETEAYEAQAFPVAVGSIGLAGLLVLWLTIPELVDTIWTNMRRTMFLGQTDTALTISEAQSMDIGNLGEEFTVGYGFTFVVAVVALVLMGGRALLERRPRPEYLLMVVWTVFLTLMSITQVRFHYYLVVPVAVLNGWLIVRVLDAVDYPSLTANRDIETYHVLVVATIIFVVVAPIASPIAFATAPEVADRQSAGDAVVWSEANEWMSENTPHPGTYGDADEPMDYYGPFDGGDGDYEYPEGAYGVMSWWDYGHYITVDGERIPNANPFQEGPRPASAFFQATDEERANLYLDALPAHDGQGSGIDDLSDEELQEIIDERSEQESGEETRFVMIDDQMAGEKFAPMTEWTGPGLTEYRDTQEVTVGENETEFVETTSETYDETLLSELYFDDAQGLETYRLVHEAEQYSYVGGVLQQTPTGEFQQRWRFSQPLFAEWSEDVQAIDQQLQQASQADQAVPFPALNGLAYDGQIVSSVKSYERVEGATLRGEAEPNQTVTATVTMETNTDRQFTYSQQTTADDDGTFEMTVPYSTTNELGPEDGYTDTAVVANGTYTVFSGSFEPEGIAEDVEVDEPAVYDGDEVEVELEEFEFDENGNETAEDEETDDETTDDETEDTDDDDGDETNDARPAIAG